MPQHSLPRRRRQVLRHQATRRPRGTPRRLLLEAARDLFARQDYRSTTTLEIAEQLASPNNCSSVISAPRQPCFARPSLLPFTGFVDDFAQTWETVVPQDTDEEDLARQFVGQLYDVFLDHRGLLVTLLSAEALSETEMADTGIAEVSAALAVLGRISAEGRQLRGMQSGRPELAAHSIVAMIAGMAALRSTYFGSKPPSGKMIVEELTQASLHGFLHRQD